MINEKYNNNLPFVLYFKNIQNNFCSTSFCLLLKIYYQKKKYICQIRELHDISVIKDNCNFLFSDLLSEGASDRMSLPPDDSSIKDSDINSKVFRGSPQLEVLPPPPNMNSKKSSLVS